MPWLDFIRLQPYYQKDSYLLKQINKSSFYRVELWEYKFWKHNKFNFIHDQFPRIFSDKFMFYNSFRSYCDNFKEETDLTEYNSICLEMRRQNNEPSNHIACLYPEADATGLTLSNQPMVC